MSARLGLKQGNDTLPNFILVQHLIVADADGVHYFIRQGPPFPQGNFQLPRVC